LGKVYLIFYEDIMAKKYLNIDVYTAAKQRIKDMILTYDDFYVSFSGGKDSGVMLELVVEVARELNRLPVKAVFSDLEIIFYETVDYVLRTFDRPEIKGYWLCIEEMDDNASSLYERYFKIWDQKQKDKWVHNPPNRTYVITEENIPDKLKKYLKPGDIEYWSIYHFGEYLCDELNLNNICNFIGMRTEESYGRYMCVATEKNRNKLNHYTYKTKTSGERTSVSLPIYDWEYKDIWHYYAITNSDYNKIYSKMHKLGLKFSMMRTCSALGEEQKKSLYYWKIFEPSTFDRMLKRVQGVNFGSIYNHTNINRGKIKKPDTVTWKQYLMLLMQELPKEIQENFNEKFRIVFNYHKLMYEQKEGIPKSVYIQDSRKDAKEAAKKHNLGIKYFISYETLCGAIIKRDFVFKKYGFGYSNKMQKRIEEVCNKWKNL